MRATVSFVVVTLGAANVGCGPPCDAEDELPALQVIWDNDRWEVRDGMPSEPEPMTPADQILYEQRSLRALARGEPEPWTQLRVGTNELGCPPELGFPARRCYSYQLFFIVHSSAVPGIRYTLHTSGEEPVAVTLRLFTRNPAVAEPEPPSDGSTYFHARGHGTVDLEEFGPDVRLDYDLTFENDDGRVRHITGSVETRREVQCPAE